MSIHGISIVICARDEAANLGRCLDILAAQQGVGEMQVILVDGGSRDRTPRVAAEHGATVIPIAPQRFSFGGALNAGAQAARHPVIVALSAHAFAPDDDWLARLATWFAADDVIACACGDRYDPCGDALTQPVVQEAELARRRPDWGYGKAAGRFAPICGAAGRSAPICRAARTRNGRGTGSSGATRALSTRRWPSSTITPTTRCGRSTDERAGRPRGTRPSSRNPPGPATPAALAHSWWGDTRWYGSRVRGRLSHRRAAQLLGAYAGRQD